MVRITIIAVIVLLQFCVANARGQNEPRPNILFIMTDQQHAGMMSCTGNANLKTPTLDALASKGLRFDLAYATNPVCVPSRFSLQTGRMPSAIGMRTNERELPVLRQMTERVDKQIGTVLDALKESGLEDNTLVIFTSDHGDMDAAHHLVSKGILYEESVGVPFIMAMKGTIPGGRVDRKHLVSNGLDLLPTLCDYAGIETPRELAGRSLRPLAEGRDVAEWRSDVFAESRNGRMVRTARFKYCVHEAGERREMLVDLDRDPGEMKNLAGAPRYRDELNRHRRLLLSWLEKQQDTLGLSYAVRPGGGPITTRRSGT